jgi:endonuclease/exonuclease/phosphatase (EEP) superfamily protein YafD
MSKETAPAGPGKGNFTPWLLRGSVAGLAAAAVATLAGRLGHIAWPFELMSHFTVQILAVQALATGIVLGFGYRRIATVFLPFALVNLLLIAPYAWFGAWRAEAAGGPTRLTVMAANVHYSKHDVELLRAEIRRIDPDVLVIVEPSANYYGDDSPLRLTHPHVLFHRDGAGTGIMMASRIPWERASTLTLSTKRSPSVFATFCRAPERGPAGCVDVLGVHPISPLGPERSRLRDAELKAVAEFVRERQPQRFIVMGDFNITPWSVRFDEFLESSGLSENPVGRGLTSTWTSKNPLFGLPIDHVLVGREIHVLDQEVGMEIGSDHYPIAARVAF